MDDEPVLVDAIEDGKIVRVSNVYARNEGLLILRKVSSEKQQPTALASTHMVRSWRARKELPQLEELRRPLRMSESDLRLTLMDNFHWRIVEQRKKRRMTRKQLAEALHEKEEHVKAIENGVLPYRDYVLIGKIEQYFGISLRRDGTDFQRSPSEIGKESGEKKKYGEKAATENIKGDEIEILEE